MRHNDLVGRIFVVIVSVLFRKFSYLAEIASVHKVGGMTRRLIGQVLKEIRPINVQEKVGYKSGS